MNDDFYTTLGYFVFWVMKYISIPIIVGVSITVIAHKLLKPLPKKQKKRRFK
jgi:uncharacterized membrane-anchored protein YhcB (DUF1043 family)